MQNKYVWVMDEDIDWLDQFDDDGVPTSLKAVLYERYMHWDPGYKSEEKARQEFLEWYRSRYLNRKRI